MPEFQRKSTSKVGKKRSLDLITCNFGNVFDKNHFFDCFFDWFSFLTVGPENFFKSSNLKMFWRSIRCNTEQKFNLIDKLDFLWFSVKKIIVSREFEKFSILRKRTRGSLSCCRRETNLWTSIIRYFKLGKIIWKYWNENVRTKWNTKKNAREL